MEELVCVGAVTLDEVEAVGGAVFEYEDVRRDAVRDGRIGVDDVEGGVGYEMAVCCCIGGAKASIMVVGSCRGR